MAYIGKSPAGLGVRARYFYTATGGETSLSGADDNGRVLQFTDGEYVDVYLNGVLLVAGTDYGTGTANTISGLDALSAGNIVEIVAYDIFSLGKANTEALRRRYYKTASGGETSISGSDDNGLTITFAANAEIEVYLNGVALVQGDDYNTSTANTVGGLSALDADDIVTIVAYEEFVLGDVVSKKDGGTFGNSISVSGDLTVDTSTLKVDSTNNRVGIGTINPSQALTVNGAGARIYLTGANEDIDMDGSSNGQIQIDGNGYTGAIALNADGLQIYNNSSGRAIIFGTNETERVRIQAGGGISFNGDTAAANALDDYEEGSWTPGVVGMTFQTAEGRYTKIGSRVQCSGLLINCTSGTASSSQAKLSGLPFTVGNHMSGTALEDGGLITYWANLGHVASACTLAPDDSSTESYMYYIVGTGSTTVTPLLRTALDASNFSCRFAFSYTV